MNKKLPKVLIVSRLVWNEKGRTSSTLANIFANYDSEKLAMIYIETKQPYSKVCKQFFRISEVSLISRIFKWNTKTGQYIDNRNREYIETKTSVAKKEARLFSFFRKNRSEFYEIAREILWLFGGWKSKALKEFIHDYKPDVIWIDGSPLILMNRLSNYVIKEAGVPASIFMQDDIYTWEGCQKGLLHKLHRYFLRKVVLKLTSRCSNMFTASPKMKEEYERIFGLNAQFITKGVEFDKLKLVEKPVISPIRLVYMGKMIYGRIYSLIQIAQTLKEINKNGIRMVMDVYSADPLSDEEYRSLFIDDMVTQKPLVPYSEVNNVIQQNDVVVFVESFDPRFINVARLSFSTKIVDYLQSGKCILAVGPGECGPIKYLRDEDAAIVAGNTTEIGVCVKKLMDPNIISNYANKSTICARKNHEKSLMDNRIFGTLVRIVNNG